MLKNSCSKSHEDLQAWQEWYDDKYGLEEHKEFCLAKGDSASLLPPTTLPNFSGVVAQPTTPLSGVTIPVVQQEAQQSLVGTQHQVGVEMTPASATQSLREQQPSATSLPLGTGVAMLATLVPSGPRASGRQFVVGKRAVRPVGGRKQIAPASIEHARPSTAIWLAKTKQRTSVWVVSNKKFS